MAMLVIMIVLMSSGMIEANRATDEEPAHCEPTHAPSDVDQFGGVSRYHACPSLDECEASDTLPKDPVHNCYIVISSLVTENMHHAFSAAIPGTLFFITDAPSPVHAQNVYHYASALMTRRGFMHSHSSIDVTSWDKVFFLLGTRKGDGGHVRLRVDRRR